jgi:hypothetical protein
VSLVDLRLAEPSAIVEEPLFKARGLRVLSLAVRWLALQDPRGRFTPERPRLPGQRYPGLGLGKRLYERLMVWAKSGGRTS